MNKKTWDWFKVLLWALALGVSGIGLIAGCLPTDSSNPDDDDDTTPSDDDDDDDDNDSDGDDDSDCEDDASCHDGSEPDAGFYCGAYECALYTGETDASFEFDNKDAPHLGNPDVVNVVVNEFTNFGCPECKTFVHQFKEWFKDPKYSDKAVVYIGYSPFPAPMSWDLHLAVQAAHLQGYFWEAHDHFFSDDAFPVASDKVKEEIESLGVVDMIRWEDDFLSDEVYDYVQADQSEFYEAEQHYYVNVGQVPRIFINGVMVRPMDPPYTHIKNILDCLLGYSNHPQCVPAP